MEEELLLTGVAALPLPIFGPAVADVGTEPVEGGVPPADVEAAAIAANTRR